MLREERRAIQLALRQMADFARLPPRIFGNSLNESLRPGAMTMAVSQIRIAFLFVIVLACAEPARAELHWPTWLGGKSTTVTKANRKTSRAVRPTTASGKGKSKNLFTNTSNLFKKKPKSKTVSKWPSDKSREESRKSSEEKKPWFDSWFGPKEPERLQTVDDWMKLEQITP